jgi:hypothetical protein
MSMIRYQHVKQTTTCHIMTWENPPSHPANYQTSPEALLFFCLTTGKDISRVFSLQNTLAVIKLLWLLLVLLILFLGLFRAILIATQHLPSLCRYAISFIRSSPRRWQWCDKLNYSLNCDLIYT